MSMLKDPEMKEIVDGFCEESNDLCQQLEDILDEYEENPGKIALLEQFGQIIDRIMGAAKSIDAEKTGNFCELGKIVSYKASQTDDMKLLEIVTAVLFDTLDILNSLLENIEKSGEEKVEGINLETFANRLKWLEEKFSHVERASVSIDENEPKNKQESIDQLLADLGL
tara:strand:- start:1177 stop:1683 length:507 start_codon:yes stop_codon:yes gene_type:complete